MKPYYVLLTGSKNNAGDFLIKHRGKALFARLRPDRDIVDLNAWEHLDEEKLKLINGAKALILLGGPSLRYEMYPGIYRLTDDLSEIKVPITFMGVGWKSASGEWSDSYKYSFSDSSMELLNRARSSGLPMSVRDFHSLNSLRFNGIRNVMMTGCPAYYDLESMEHEPTLPPRIKSVGFSLGVSFVQSKSMERQMKRQILACQNYFEGAQLEVLFHHSLALDETRAVYGRSMLEHVKRHREFAEWLDSEGIPYRDISGSADKLMAFYRNVDLHVGYRVHAHIYMSSISKPSLLLSEDGRAKGSKGAIGGMVVDGYDRLRDRLAEKLCRRVFGMPDRFVANEFSTDEMLFTLDYEIFSGGQRTSSANRVLKRNFELMQEYLRTLP